MQQSGAAPFPQALRACLPAQLVQVLLELFTYWSVRVKCAVRYSPAARLEDASHVRVDPHAFSGTKEVVPLRLKKVVSGEVPCSLWVVKRVGRAAQSFWG